MKRILLFAVLVVTGRALAVTTFVEAETATPADQWTIQDLKDARGGKVLTGAGKVNGAESGSISLRVPTAGQYRIWIRYFKKKEEGVNLYALIRDESGEVQAFGRFDWQAGRVPNDMPYETKVGKTGFVWESFDARFDRAFDGKLCVGGGRGERTLDCFALTSDMSSNPPTAEVAAPVSEPVSVPPGFVASAGLPMTPASFAGIADPERWFYAGLINVGSIFRDDARLIRLGFNHDHTGFGVIGKLGLRAMMPVESANDPQFAKAHPSPEGRFVNAKGDVGAMFSLHYQPFVEVTAEALRKRVKELNDADDGSLGFWRTSSEEGGWLDYSSYAVEAFRKWLKVKHETIETLNGRWGTKFASFDEIAPAKSYDEGHACWLEFRQFSGEAYAASVGRRIEIVKATDPKHRPCLGANSNLDIGAPFFMAFRPNDFEELVRVGLKDEKHFAFDIYCADDDMASSIDFFTSIAGGRKLINQEFSNHVVDPRIAARTYWMQVGKGVHGIHLFTFQGMPSNAQYPKWGLLSDDLSPKAKLAAYSDAVQEVHRLEPLLMNATYTHAVKPVAMYWSRIDLSLDQPRDSWYGHGLDSPPHVYETLRSLGYPVRWITPRQITAGELENVSALVMVGCNHVPQAAAGKIEAWVKAGGAIVGDSWPGAFDEYGQPQATLTPIFGVRPTTKKTKDKASQLALQESKQGYGEVTDTAAVRENIFQKIDEMAQQPDATHPVAKALGDFMLTGYGLDKVDCIAGKVVGMTHHGSPGLVVNEYGQGKALYSAFLLGTIYESAPVRYEWDSTHSGLSFGRVFDAFLKYAGAKPGCGVDGLPPRVAAKLRIESPLVTPDGNVLVGLTSMNDDAVRPFDLEIELPVQQFAKVFIATSGNRQLIPVQHQIVGTKLKLHMPAFDTHATIFALKDAGPLVSLELKSIVRGPANLAVIKPGQTFEVETVVYNSSLRALPAGKLTFNAPIGWLQSASEAKLAAIPAGGEARFTFRVQAPAQIGLCRLVPLLARYEDTAPAGEMVWWGLQ